MVFCRNISMRFAIVIFCFGIFFSACKKTEVAPYQSLGVITGYDTRMCPMCGGLFITIKNDTTKNAPAHYDINSDLPHLGISATKFPINVSLNWMHDTSSLGRYGYIIVTKIKVIN